MTLPTTDKLKELRERITPGPWKIDPETDGIKNSEDTNVVWGDAYRDGDEAWLEWRFDADYMLAALAPELLDEVIRLREALIRLQMDMRHQPHQYLADEVANAIRIILEGDTND